jgi:hypothetical protein
MTSADSDHETICGAMFPHLPSRRCVLPAGHEGNHRHTEQSAEPDSPAVARRPRSLRRTKRCPECAERVMVAALVCRVCGNRFDTPLDQAAAPPRAEPQMSSPAVTAFMCSIVGIWIVSIPLGIRARRAVDRSEGLLTGRGFGTAGIVLGLIDMIATVVLVIALATHSG